MGANLNLPVPIPRNGVSPAGENRFEACLGQDPSDLFPFVALYLDASLLHRSSNPAALLHLLGEGLFFGLPDSLEVLDYGNRLAAAMSSLPDDVHAPAVGILLSTGRRLRVLALRVFNGSRGGRGEVFEGGKPFERIVSQRFASVGRFTFLLTAHASYLGNLDENYRISPMFLGVFTLQGHRPRAPAWTGLLGSGRAPLRLHCLTRLGSTVLNRADVPVAVRRQWMTVEISLVELAQVDRPAA